MSKTRFKLSVPLIPRTPINMKILYVSSSYCSTAFWPYVWKTVCIPTQLPIPCFLYTSETIPIFLLSYLNFPISVSGLPQSLAAHTTVLTFSSVTVFLQLYHPIPVWYIFTANSQAQWVLGWHLPCRSLWYIYLANKMLSPIITTLLGPWCLFCTN